MEDDRRKVAIVGSSDTTRNDAPYSDPSWEIWVINDMCLLAPRVDRVFDIHDEPMILADAAINEGVRKEVEWLRANSKIDVYMRDSYDWVPRAKPYPVDEVVKEFGSYLTNTASYMIALALYEGVDEIGLWGIDMAHGTEYAAQLPSCEYFIGVARGRGVPVHVPEASTLLASRFLYGVSNPLSADLDARIGALANTGAEWRNHEVEAKCNQAKVEGALEILHYIKATYG